MNIQRLPLITILVLLLFVRTTYTLTAQTVNNLAGNPYVETPANFLVNEVGMAQYRIPIKIPKGTGGMQPNISISYSSSGGNGILGKNWSLGGLSAITRVPATLAQDGLKDGVDFDRNDKFALDGQRLIHVKGSVNQNNSQYRTEQATFQRIIAHGSIAGYPDNFTLEVSNGTKKIYGWGGDGNSKSFISNHDAVHIWNLSKVTDVHGNYYTITYFRDNGRSLISRIDYTGNSKGNLATFASIRFEYEGRGDNVRGYLAGDAIQLNHRLKYIKVFYKEDLIRTYTLSYEEFGASKTSLLKSVQECAANSTACAEKINFDWQKGEIPSFSTSVRSENTLFNTSINSIANEKKNLDPKHPDWVLSPSQIVHNTFLAEYSKIHKQVKEYDLWQIYTDNYNRVHWRLVPNPQFVIILKVDGQDNKTFNFTWNNHFYKSVYGIQNFYKPVDNKFVKELNRRNGWFSNIGRTLYPYSFLPINIGGSLNPIEKVIFHNAVSKYSHFTLTYRFMKKGGGTFDFTKSFSKNGAFSPSRTGDFNGDGKVDVIQFNEGGIQVVYGSGDAYRPSSRTSLGIFKLGKASNDYDLSADEIVLGDVNGDGRTDIVGFNSDGVDLALSTGNTFEYKENVFGGYHAAHGWNKSRHIRTLADVNGDGRADIVAFGEIGVSVAISRGDGWDYAPSWDASTKNQFGASEAAGSWSVKKTPRYLADVNGDGLPDVIGFYYNGIHLALNTGNGFSYQNGGQPVLNGFNDAQGWDSNKHIRTVADVNGDGLADIIGFFNNHVSVAVSNGRNGWISQDSWEKSTQNTFGYADEAGGWRIDKNSRILADMNGDGKADIVGYKSDGIHVALSTGQSFLNKGVMVGTDHIKNRNIMTLGDVNGDGLPDPVIYHDNGVDFHLNNGKVLYQNKITNATKEILITQKPITDATIYKKQATAAVYPRMDFQGAMYVVSQVKQSNGLGPNLNGGNPYFTTKYTYEGAKVNLLGRGFRGFCKTQSTEIEKGIRTEIEYKTDPKTTFRSPYLITKINTKNNHRLSQVENEIAFKKAYPYSDKVFFSYYPKTTTRLYKVSDGSRYSTIVTTRKNNAVYGLITEEKTTYEDGRSVTTKTYPQPALHNESKWVLNMVNAISKTYTAPNQPTKVYNDWFMYENEGTNQNIGNISNKIVNDFTKPTFDAKLKITTHYQYDDYGNVVEESIFGDDGYGKKQTRTTKTTYDQLEHRLVIKQTNPLGHTVVNRFNATGRKFGLPYETVDINGLVTQYEFDAFGQIRKTKLPSGIESVTDTRLLKDDKWAWDMGMRYRKLEHTAGKSPVWTYFDALGRKARTVTFNFNPHVALSNRPVYEDFRYDHQGNLVIQYEPFYWNSVDPKNANRTIEYTYDILNRITQKKLPGGRISKTIYDGLITTFIDPENKTKTQRKRHSGILDWVDDHNKSRLTFTYTADGLPYQTIAPGSNNITTYTYDPVGNLVRESIPNKKTGGFIEPTHDNIYNAFGELVKKTTAANEVIQYHYDNLGRLISRKDDNNGINKWEYDKATHGKGLVNKMTTPNGLTRTYTYDQYGRLKSNVFAFEGNTYKQLYTYDNLGRLETYFYDTNKDLRLRYEYDDLGNLIRIKNAKHGDQYWKLNNVDAAGRITKETQGAGANKKITTYRYNDAGFLANLTVPGVIDFEYRYDKAGNMKLRKDKISNRSETFSYDNLHRLTCSDCSSAYKRSYTYDKLGNKLTDSDIGTYNQDNYIFKTTSAYSGAGPTKDKFGTMIFGRGYRNTQFDQKGNRTAYKTSDDQIAASNGSLGKWGYTKYYTISYNINNKPIHIKRYKTKNFADNKWKQVGYVDTKFTYDENYNRIKQQVNGFKARNEAAVTSSASNTLPRSAKVNLNESKIYVTPDYLITTTNGKTKSEMYINANNRPIALFTLGSPQNSLEYLHLDNLGSIVAVSGENGNVLASMNYDAWGRARNSNWEYYKKTTTGKTMLDFDKVNNKKKKDFTGHERLEESDLIHMNGRLYDYNLGVMLSMDPVIQDPTNLQNYNRYSYVLNNPFKFTDPSGNYFESVSSFFSDVGNWFANVWSSVPSTFNDLGSSSFWYGNTSGSYFNDWGSTLDFITPDFEFANQFTSTIATSYNSDIFSNTGDSNPLSLFSLADGYGQQLSLDYDLIPYLDAETNYFEIDYNYTTSVSLFGRIGGIGAVNDGLALEAEKNKFKGGISGSTDGVITASGSYGIYSVSYDTEGKFRGGFSLPFGSLRLGPEYARVRLGRDIDLSSISKKVPRKFKKYFNNLKFSYGVQVEIERGLGKSSSTGTTFRNLKLKSTHNYFKGYWIK